MCGRYGFATPEKIEARYGIKNPYNLSPRYNIVPTDKMPVIANNGELELMHWGLIPYWAKDLTNIKPQINARADGIADKATFRKPIRFQRCLVPATNFYEWKKTEDGKIPYNIKVKDEDIFSFAGIYDIWKNQQGETIKSYAIITTDPNSLMEDIHHRMPVILHREDEQDWLNPDNIEPTQIESFLKPYPAKEMEAYEISKLVNVPTNDTPNVISPV